MSFSTVRYWVFDLDNTLYPRKCRLLDQIERRITSCVTTVTGLSPVAARALQKDYLHKYGTTLRGLMQEWDVEPKQYLAHVHSIDYSAVAANPGLMNAIDALPGRKLIFTNADSAHAEAVIDRLGGKDVFDGIFDVVDAGYVPKPHRSSFEKFLRNHRIDPAAAAMFEDMAINLVAADALGMRTVHVVPGHDGADDGPVDLANTHKAAHIHHVTSDLETFIRAFEHH